MKFRLFTFSALCVLAIAVLLMMTPAVAQNASHDTQPQMSKDSASSNNSADMIPGTGLTMAELRDLGYTPTQIADIQAGASGGGSTMAGSSAQEKEQPNAASSNAAGNTSSSGSGWGLWGLIGLLGLLGLGGRSRRAEVRDERDRDIRRVA